MAQKLSEWKPEKLAQVQKLVDAHKLLKEEPLLLAIYYTSPRAPDDFSIFEVIENFGSNSVDPDKELFEVTYESSAQFPMHEGQQLRLVLTNPRELQVALQERWALLEEVRDAVKQRRAKVIWQDPIGAKFLESLRA
jgi:hypothetical protein